MQYCLISKLFFLNILTLLYIKNNKVWRILVHAVTDTQAHVTVTGSYGGTLKYKTYKSSNIHKCYGNCFKNYMINLANCSYNTTASLNAHPFTVEIHFKRTCWFLILFCNANRLWNDLLIEVFSVAYDIKGSNIHLPKK